MIPRSLLLYSIYFFASSAYAANVFNMPSGQTSLEFVTVGDPSNVADSRYYNNYPSRPGLALGSIVNTYQIGKYQVTLAQYTVFLNAIAKADPYGLINGTGVFRSGTSGNYSYSVSSPARDNAPVGVTWNQAARFVNWLHNGQPTGPQGPATTESGVYDLFTVGPFTLNGNEVTRNINSTYFIPTEDEWYKAAYYKGGGVNAGYWTYATQSDVTPSNVISATGMNNANYDSLSDTTPVGFFAGSPSFYGTFDQNGNGPEWTETYYPAGFGRIIRNGGIYDTAEFLSADRFRVSSAITSGFGFRVASIAPVPEPSSTLVVLGLLAAGLGVMRLRKR